VVLQAALNSSRPRIAAAMGQLEADISAGLEALDYVPGSKLGKTAVADMTQALWRCQFQIVA
jgi:hypothetical protein